MKLAQEFIRLPFSFDARRLQREVAALPQTAWQAHPTGFKGNTAVPLISVDGELNDYFAGPMKETRWLKQMPYTRQVLASFGVVFGRSRLMCLDGGAEVTAHCDANYHWFTRARIHVPVTTYPEVEFHCGDKRIHMAEGEAWIFDNWRRHAVYNRSPHRRIHLVADTLGSSRFWSMVERSLAAAESDTVPEMRFVEYAPEREVSILGEKYNTPDVMAPSELKELCEDLIADLNDGTRPQQRARAESFARTVRNFYRDWAMLWTLHGAEPSGWDDYERLRNGVIEEVRRVREPLVLGNTGLVAQQVLFARVLVACVRRPLPGVRTLQFAP